MLLLVSGATQTLRSDTVGHLVVPRQWNDPKSLNLQAGRWAIDNGAFIGFDAGAYMRTLERFSDQPGCLFATAPDFVGDAAATRDRWPFWSKVIRAAGYQPAFVAQDGLLDFGVPWDELGCLFIGGSTMFKESGQVRDLVLTAIYRGLWVHWGRVNGKRRLGLIMKAMGDSERWSIDGTGFSMYPDTNIPKVAEWVEQIQAQPELGYGSPREADDQGPVPRVSSTLRRAAAVLSLVPYQAVEESASMVLAQSGAGISREARTRL
jgi:hypothetical protein